VGTNPRGAPIVEPVSRSQAPTSTANPNAVNVETPRRHPDRRTTGVYSLLAAIATIVLSRRALRAGACNTASCSASNANCGPCASKCCSRSHTRCAPVQARPPYYTIP
jgi:hypothetical protein